MIWETLVDWYRTTNLANSAGFLIRYRRLFDAIREELVPYGTQTFPSVASASLCLIKRNLRRYLLNFVVHIFSQAVSSMLYISCRSLLFLYLSYSSPIHPEEANTLRMPHKRTSALCWALCQRASHPGTVVTRFACFCGFAASGDKVRCNMG